MSGSSTSAGLNVAAKPFVPSFGANASSKLNPTARAFVPSFDAAPAPNSANPPTTTATSTAASTLNTAAPVFVPTSTASSATIAADTVAGAAAAPSTAVSSASSSSSSSVAAPPSFSSSSSSSSASSAPSSSSAPSPSRPSLDPFLSSLPAPSARRPLTGSASAKVRKPKSAQDDDDSVDRRSGQSYSSRHGNSGGLAGSGGAGHYGLSADKSFHAQPQHGDNGVSFSSTGGSGPLADGGVRQYSIDLLLSLRSLLLSQQWPIELDDGCEAILVGKYNNHTASMNGSASHDKRQSGGAGHGNELFRSADREKDSGANSAGWRDTLAATPPATAADNAANTAATASATAAAASSASSSSSSASLRPALSLRPSASLRPGASAQSSVGRLRTKQTSFQPHDKQAAQQGRGGSSSGGGQQKDGGNAYNRKGKDAPLDIEVAPLERTEHRYTVVKDIPPDAKLLRALNAILNKLTPEKFDTLLEQVLALKISNVGLLRDVVTAIFEKALAEPNFSPTYAQFCVVLSEKLPTFADDEGEQTFRKLILNRCQAEFEEGNKLSEQQQASMSAEEKEQHATMMKRRTLGTIRFIGELYIRQLIASRILRHCAALLYGDINAPVEEDIEALCRLLDTTGKFLEHSKGRDAKVNHDFLHSTLSQLGQLKDRRELLSSRIRFMIADVLDVQKSGWVNRRAADQAKKISAVHEEAAKHERETAQQAELQRMYQSMQQQPLSAANRPSPASRMARPTDRYALPQPATHSTHSATQPGQWETVGGGKGAKQGAAAAALGKHSSSAKRAADSETNEEVNAYALLNRRGGREEKEHDDEDDDDDDEDENDEEDDGGVRRPDSGSAADQRLSSSALSADELRDRASSLVKELCSSEDVSDAVLSVEELGAINCDERFIEAVLLAALETKKESHKLLLCRVLAEAGKRKLLAPRGLQHGMVAVLAQLDDIAIDLPKCDEYCAILLAQLAADSALSLSLLSPAVLQSVSSTAGAGSRFFLSVLQQMKRLTGGEEAVVTAVRQAQSDSSEPLNLLAVLDKSKDQAQKQLVDKKLDQVAEKCLGG